MKRALTSRILSRTGLRSILERAIPWSGVLVLNYHRIGNADNSPFDHGLWSADADAFTEQVRFCKSHLQLISPAELPAAVASGRGRYGMITFDDGYRDNYEVAFPILKAEGVPATFFITTGFIDAPKVPWWDEIAWMARTGKRERIELPNWLAAPVLFDEPTRENAVRILLSTYKALPSNSTERFLDAIALATGTQRCPLETGRQFWMNWDIIREMRLAGMTIGGHTITHPNLARSTPQQQRDEILGCADRLRDELGDPMVYFSFPVGGRDSLNDLTRACLREAKVNCAFSYYGGFRNFSDWDAHDVRRVPVESYLTADWFRAIVCLPQFFA